MKKIIVRSPTRVDLAGGTLDLWPLYLFVGGATTINVAIDIYTTAEIEEREDSEIHLFSKDLNLEKKYKNLNECLADSDPRLHLLQVQIKFWQPKKGFSLKTSSESPVGGGLGGSSSLTISLLKAFNQFCSGQLNKTQDLVSVAHNVEAEVLNTPTGTQDYYPAASGGLNILKYNYSGIEQKILPIVKTPLEKNFMLVYTGKAHHSGLNNFEVMQRSVAKEEKTIHALKNLKKVSEQMAQICEAGQWQKLPDLFKQELEYRVQLAKAFSSPEIEQLAELTLQGGAEAVKICGAGGGGCVLVWVNEANRQGVADKCQKAGFKILAAKPVSPL